MKFMVVAALLLCQMFQYQVSGEEKVPKLELKADASPYAGGQFSVSPFASYRVREFDGKLDRFGGGLAFGYSPTRNITVEAEAISEGINTEHAAKSFTEAGGNFKGYLPLGDTGFAPYGLIGYTRDLKRDANRMNAGAGIEFRANKTFAIFADGRWTHDFENLGHALFRVGGSIRF